MGRTAALRLLVAVGVAGIALFTAELVVPSAELTGASVSAEELVEAYSGLPLACVFRIWFGGGERGRCEEDCGNEVK